ncbi:hypothetical protein FSW04_01315 [Baekduia soli]|uniref:Uncharacterized protein n=1 Tax=Baekduia soli TaxID=496014 RepID=A0A5B8U033_9ACTN|nr:hypothetical protein [Baekduia soli]QEC46347.1 hypothetical protein FSW04_01315 [Baekduia soli]
MNVVGRFFGRYLLRRVLRGQQRGRGSYGARGYGPGGRAGRGGFGRIGPFPSYSARTRRGNRVTVSGCCLPLALSPLAVGALAARVLRSTR